MFCQAGFDQWLTTIMQHLSHLSKPQATVLALWSLGMVLAHSCALSAVSHLLAAGTRRNAQTVRQQLREWYYDVARKRGTNRQALRVETCFRPLLGWVVSWWQGTPLALAIDATALGTRFVVLAVSVVYRGCAIPVAWVVLPANTPQAWRREWLRLLRLLRPAIPRHWQVIVLADRGLYAPWLFRRIVRLGWPPFLRINTGGTFRPAVTRGFRPLATFVPRPGMRWRGRGTAFQKHGSQLECTLLACWEEGYKDPWLILTDLPPEASDAAWYGLRAWIEQGFKITKRAGWQWHRTRMRAPDRAARLWLAVAVATLWLLSVGGAADETIPVSTLLDVTALCPGRPRTRRATRLRLVSVFRQGWVALLVALLRQEPWPEGRFVPEPWPVVPAWEDEPCGLQMALPEAA
jgi:Transposase DDE domain